MEEMLANVPGPSVIEKLAHLYFTTQSGMMRLPLLIPGTNYYNAIKVSNHFVQALLFLTLWQFSLKKLCLLHSVLCLQNFIFLIETWMMQARSILQTVLRKVIADRRSGQVRCDDFLQSLLLPMEDGSLLTEDQIMDNIFSLLGASDVTTSTVLVWMVKNISEHPQVYEDLKVLHLFTFDLLEKETVDSLTLSFDVSTVSHSTCSSDELY